MIETVSTHACFAGLQGFYRHESSAIGLPMRFAVYQPPQATSRQVPVLFYLAGLTCTEETFIIKAGAQRLAAEHGVMLVSCDTSPRNTGIAGEADDWEFGSGAGFYLDATQQPWSKHFRMYDYVLEELRAVVLGHFPADARRIGIFGHSMGGHGALVLALRNPERLPLGERLCPDLRACRVRLGPEGPAPVSWRGPGRVVRVRRLAAHAQSRPAGVRQHPRRPGTGRQVPRAVAIASGAVRSGLRRCGAGADACGVMRATTTATTSLPAS